MSATATITTAVNEVQTIGDEILAVLEAVDPAVDLPAAAAGSILDLLAQMTTKALAALTAAQGTVISAASIATLAPDPTPLTPPTP
jgi:hypothetical protein